MSQVDVRQAVAAVRAFIKDLFGEQQLEFSRLEEVGYDEDANEWWVTMSLASPASIVLSKDAPRDLKRFIVDASNGEVMSMRMWGE